MSAWHLSFHYPWVLALAPLILLPLLMPAAKPSIYPWIKLLPADPLSRLLDVCLRLLGITAITALLAGLAGLHETEQPFQQVSRGAEIVILLDRSRSMDQRLVSRDNSQDWLSAKNLRKGEVSKRLLAEFVAARPQDRFAFLLFSTRTMEVSNFTREHGMVQAAISASQTGRGIADTELGVAVAHGLEMFARRPFVGPRAMLLVSDGGARLDEVMKQRLTRLLAQTQVGLYWIYLRSAKSPGLMADETVSAAVADTVPEHFLHKFFQSSAVFYKAYQADSQDAMRDAIADISRLENRPIRHREVRPVNNLDRWCLAIASAAIALLLLFAVLLSARRGVEHSSVTAGSDV